MYVVKRFGFHYTNNYKCIKIITMRSFETIFFYPLIHQIIKISALNLIFKFSE